MFVSFADAPTNCTLCNASIPPGDAVKVFWKFDVPIPADIDLGFPAIEGVFVEYCARCAKEKA